MLYSHFNGQFSMTFRWCICKTSPCCYQHHPVSINVFPVVRIFYELYYKYRLAPLWSMKTTPVIILEYVTTRSSSIPLTYLRGLLMILKVHEHILWIKFMNTFCQIALRWMTQNTCDEKSTFIQVMVWCRLATGHYEPMLTQIYGVTRPQWLKCSFCFRNCKTVSLLMLLFPSKVA